MRAIPSWVRAFAAISDSSSATVPESRSVGRWLAAVPGEEPCRLVTPQVAIQDRLIDGREIDHHERVQRVPELRVDVDSKQFRVQLQVLAQQHRDALPVRFRAGHESVHLIDRFGDCGRRRWIDRTWSDRVHQFREIAIAVIVPEKLHEQAVRGVRVPRADTDRAKQHAVLRMARDELPDGFPQQQKRVVAPLIFGANERSAELEGWREPCDQALVISKQRRSADANVRAGFMLMPESGCSKVM